MEPLRTHDNSLNEIPTDNDQRMRQQIVSGIQLALLRKLEHYYTVGLQLDK